MREKFGDPCRGKECTAEGSQQVQIERVMLVRLLSVTKDALCWQ